MCGIAGIIRFDNRMVPKEPIQRMNAAQSHRGPDGDGIYQNGPIGFGHVRLTIIDLTNGAQPFVDNECQMILTYNGEIYNYKELKQELESEYKFSTDCDTEVLLKSFHKWGVNCLQKLRGMFAFALYDQKQNKVFLVRDRIGIKPLYYYQTADQIIFSSELKALMASEIVPNRISASAIASYLKYQYVPTPATIYENVCKLKPGHYLEIDLNAKRVEMHTYWEPKIGRCNTHEHGALANLNALLDETVSIYCRADVPFGAFLSGGTDSTLVTGVMSRSLPYPVHTFTIGFEEQGYSELDHARHVSTALATQAHEHIVAPQITEEFLAALANHFGEPFSDSSAIPTYWVAKTTAQHVKMVLSGDGGDELFAGYDSYRQIFLEQEKKWPLTRQLAFTTLSLIPPWGKVLSKIKAAAQKRAMHTEERFDYHRQIFSEADVAELMKPAFAKPERLYQKKWDLDEITHFQLLDLMSYLHDDVLTKVDRMTMANSIEARVPLLDHHLVEAAFSMPLEFKIQREGNNVISKYILKKSASRFVDWDFLNRPKQGFGIPVAEWCRGHLRPIIESSLRDKNNIIYEWLAFDKVNEFLDKFYNKKNRSGAQIWSLLMLDIWFKNVHGNRSLKNEH